MLKRISETFWIDIADIFYFNFNKEECQYELRLRSIPGEQLIIHEAEIAHKVIQALEADYLSYEIPRELQQKYPII